MGEDEDAGMTECADRSAAFFCFMISLTPFRPLLFFDKATYNEVRLVHCYMYIFDGHRLYNLQKMH